MREALTSITNADDEHDNIRLMPVGAAETRTPRGAGAAKMCRNAARSRYTNPVSRLSKNSLGYRHGERVI